MDWKYFLNLLNLFSNCYIIAFIWAGMFAAMAKDFSKINAKIMDAYWKFVTMYHFLYPARKVMWFLYTGTAYLVNTGTYWDVHLAAFFTFIACFLFKDDHGDDPRDKKPSKVKALIKSIGHKLVVVPSHG